MVLTTIRAYGNLGLGILGHLKCGQLSYLQVLLSPQMFYVPLVNALRKFLRTVKHVYQFGIKQYKAPHKICDCFRGVVP